MTVTGWRPMLPKRSARHVVTRTTMSLSSRRMVNYGLEWKIMNGMTAMTLQLMRALVGQVRSGAVNVMIE